jgi:hypothetical protein
MSISKNKYFWLTGSLAAIFFVFLFMIRLEVLQKLIFRPKSLSISAITSPDNKENWMDIFHNDRKIGFSLARISAEKNGYLLYENVQMRINTMGMVQDINLNTRGRLKSDFSLAEFSFVINSGRFSFSAKGSVADDKLTIQTASAGNVRKFDLTLKSKPYLLSGVTAAIAATELSPGDKYAFDVFDPATMGQDRLIVEVIGKEALQIMGDSQIATKISLNLRGASQIAWIGESGDILQEEGILGIRLEKTSRETALERLALKPSADLTQIASVASNVVFENPERLDSLKVEVKGISLNSVRLEGGRQTLENNVLVVEKEALDDLAHDLPSNNLKPLEKIYLRPTAFIQSDHQKIQTLAREIAGRDRVPLDRLRKLVHWVHQNIEKRPVLSLPDALATLQNRMGDCNEHAVLLAALARAAGIPCRVEAGVAYLKGRFFYHAWNLAYLGRWVTVDALFNQIPADVTHIRFVSGSPRQQLDLMGVMGKVELRVIDSVMSY